MTENGNVVAFSNTPEEEEDDTIFSKRIIKWLFYLTEDHEGYRLALEDGSEKFTHIAACRLCATRKKVKQYLESKNYNL
jgi:hypothetical protein